MNGTRMEYTGPIPELQGKTALVMKVPWVNRAQYTKPEAIWLAQFDDAKLMYNGKRMGFNWQPFPKSHFTKIDVGQKPVFAEPFEHDDHSRFKYLDK